MAGLGRDVSGSSYEPSSSKLTSYLVLILLKLARAFPFQKLYAFQGHQSVYIHRVYLLFIR